MQIKYFQHQIEEDVNEIEMDQVCNFQRINFDIRNLKHAFNPRRGNQNFVSQTKEKPKQQRPDFIEQSGVSNNPIVQQYNNKSIKGSLSNRVPYQQGKIAIIHSNMNLQNNKQNQQNLNYNPAYQRVVGKQIHQDYQNPLIQSKDLENGLHQSPKSKENLQKNQQYDNQHNNQLFDNQHNNQLYDNQHHNQQFDNQSNNQLFDNQHNNHQFDNQHNNQLFNNQFKDQQSDNLYKIRSLENLRIHQLQKTPYENIISSPEIIPIKDFSHQIRRPNFFNSKSQIQDQIQNDLKKGRVKILQNRQKYQISQSERNFYKSQIFLGNHKVEHTLAMQDTNSNQTKLSQYRRNRTDIQLASEKQDEIFETVLQTKYQRCDHCMQQQDHELFQLGCQHNYHVQCLIESISNSIQVGNTFVTCKCNTKIPQKQVLKLLENRKQIQDTLFKNQLKKLINSFANNTKKTKIVYDQNPQIIVKQGIKVKK